jgi:uncharacterized Fe-S cluster protein YjdI
MPRKNVDYSKTVMYKIVSNDLNIRDCYVGSTTDFTKRKCAHKSSCINANSKMYNFKVYKFIRDNGDWLNWSMILIEMYPCTTHLESSQRERFWCENLNATLNSMVPSRTRLEYKKQYDINNKDHLTEQNKLYRKANQEQINNNQKTVIYCVCGSSYTRCHKLRHERSKKHQEYEKNRLYYDIQRGLNIIKKLDNYFLNK